MHLKEYLVTKLEIGTFFFLVDTLIRVTLKACNSSMAAVTLDKELLQSCFKAEIEVEHYRDLTKSRNVQSII